MNQFAAVRRHVTLALVTVFLLLPLTLWGDSGPDHQVYQVRPVRFGTSGGNAKDINDFFCCSGTLGALVQDLNGIYVLSNNHIIARNNLANAGEPIIQPGLVDQNPVCSVDPSFVVAKLTQFVPLRFRGTPDAGPNFVDAAIAKTLPAYVDTTGAILDIGVINATPRNPAVGLAVKKSGRSTGLTTGQISAVHVTVEVEYTKCGIGSRMARFFNQILIDTPSFSDGGDSGSLIVENVAAAPRAVGLLFAGSDTVTVANPIKLVLKSLGVRLVGATRATLPDVDDAVVEAAAVVKDNHEDSLFAVPGVVGAAVGRATVSGQAAIHVLVNKATDAQLQAIPASIDGVEVRIIVTGGIVAR
jgi:hypothetical protein